MWSKQPSLIVGCSCTDVDGVLHAPEQWRTMLEKLHCLKTQFKCLFLSQDQREMRILGTCLVWQKLTKTRKQFCHQTAGGNQSK